MTLRLRFWLLVLDAIAALGGFGSRPYLFAVRRAADATDWGHGAELGEEAPF